MIKLIKSYYQNSPKLLISFLFFLAALFVLSVITNEIIMEKEENIDFFIFKFFETYIVKSSLTDDMYAITMFASAPFIKIVYPLLISILVVFKFYRKALFTFVAGMGGLILIYGMKMFFARPRPLYPLLYKEESFSFPSGHATLSFILYGTLAYFMWLTDLPKVWKYVAMVLLVLLSLSIGFSRIYLRVHYPSDVLAGFCLGYSWLFLMIYTFRKWFPLN